MTTFNEAELAHLLKTLINSANEDSGKKDSYEAKVAQIYNDSEPKASYEAKVAQIYSGLGGVYGDAKTGQEQGDGYYGQTENRGLVNQKTDGAIIPNASRGVLSRNARNTGFKTGANPGYPHRNQGDGAEQDVVAQNAPEFFIDNILNEAQGLRQTQMPYQFAYNYQSPYQTQTQQPYKFAYQYQSPYQGNTQQTYPMPMSASGQPSSYQTQPTASPAYSPVSAPSYQTQPTASKGTVKVNASSSDGVFQNSELLGYIQQASAETGVPTNVLLAVAQQESSGRWYDSVPDGTGHSYGYMMLYDNGVIADLKAKGQGDLAEKAKTDPYTNVLVGAQFLKRFYDQYGSWEKAAAKYNGSGAKAEQYGRKVWARANSDAYINAFADSGSDSGEAPATDNGLLNAAYKYLGKPYVWGGESDDEGGYDCSGFVYKALNDAGYKIGRTTAEGYRGDGTVVDKADLQPGDLVFYGSKGIASHIGIYAGDGKVIHSSGGSGNTKSNPGKGVCLTTLDSRDDFIEARRYEVPKAEKPVEEPVEKKAEQKVGPKTEKTAEEKKAEQAKTLREADRVKSAQKFDTGPAKNAKSAAGKKADNKTSTTKTNEKKTTKKKTSEKKSAKGKTNKKKSTKK